MGKEKDRKSDSEIKKLINQRATGIILKEDVWCVVACPFMGSFCLLTNELCSGHHQDQGADKYPFGTQVSTLQESC